MKVLEKLFETGANNKYQYSDIKLNFNKFDIIDSDWNTENISNVDYKLKIQNVICAFSIIENNISSSASPEVSQFVDNCKKELLEYMNYILNREN